MLFKSSKKRSQELEKLALSLGLTFQKKDDFGLVKMLGDFKLFKIGSFKKIRNLMRHQDRWLENQYAIFDYQYTVSTGNSAATYVQTVFFMESKKLSLPEFCLKPEHFGHRVGKFLGIIKEIDFESYPEFSKNYLIQSPTPDLLRMRIIPEIVQFFNNEKKWSLEGMNYYLIFYRNGKKQKIEDIPQFIEKGQKLTELLK